MEHVNDEIRVELSMCGYRCDLCKAHSKRVRQVDEREELSRIWQKYYGFLIPPENIVCDGCRCEEPGACRLDAGCPVRPCVLDKGLNHCGECPQYPCAKFEERIGLNRNDAMKKQPEDFIAAEYECYLAAYDNRTHLNAMKR